MIMFQVIVLNEFAGSFPQRIFTKEDHPLQTAFLNCPDKPFRVRGTARSRSVIHRYGVPHGTVLLGGVVQSDARVDEPQFVVHRRSLAKLTSPNAFDFNGGHMGVR